MKKIPLSALLVSVIVLTSVVVYSAEAAGIPKKAISTVAKFLESDLPTTTVFTDVPNTITAAITMNSLTPTLGGAENANNQQINSLAAPTHSTDAQVANHLGLLGNMVVGTCSAGQVLQYQTSNSTWICSTPVGRTLLGSTTLASAANTISVSYDPTGYSKIEYDIYTGTLSGSSTVEMQFNSDTSAHYAWSKLVAATSTTGTSASFCLFDTTGSALQRQLRVNILPAPSSAFQGAHWEGQTEAAAVSTAPLLLSGSCSWNGATTITSVQIKTTTGTINFPVGAFVNVYGS